MPYRTNAIRAASNVNPTVAMAYASVWDDPALFSREVIGSKLWPGQVGIFDAVTKHRRVAVKGCHASSKALSLETPLPTPTGWTTMGEVKIGDMLYDEMGRPTQVIQLSPITQKFCYRVRFCTGEEIVASADHLWAAIDLRHRPRGIRDWRAHWSAAYNVTTEQMFRSLRVNSQCRWRIPTTMPVAGSKWNFRLPPYTLGAWLGDGTKVRAEITCHTDEANFFAAKLNGRIIKGSGGRAPRVVFSPRPYQECPARWLGGVKRIPKDLLRSSKEDRLELLRGLMDTDGWHTLGRGVSISQVDHQLASDIRELVVSLGWRACWREQRAILNGRDCGPCYVVSFAPDVCPFHLPRKVTSWRLAAEGDRPQASRGSQRTIVAIEPVGVREVRCLGIDSPSHLYLAGLAMVPTHNTFSMGDLVVWWCMAHPAGIAIVTAPTQAQAKIGVWKEVKRAAEAASKQFLMPPVGDHEWKLRGEQNMAFIRATGSGDAGVRFQAPHGEDVLIVADEAPGIHADIFEAIEGIRAGGNVRLVLLGNPTVPTGRFYDAFTTQRDRWGTVTIDGLDTPNLKGITLCRFNGTGDSCDGSAREGEPRCKLAREVHLREMPWDEGGPLDQNEFPSLLTRRWVREYLEDVGELNPRFDARVRGRFPQQAEGALVPLVWLEAAKWRLTGFEELSPEEIVRRIKHRVTAGVDVAEAGEDESVLYVHDHGHLVAPPTTYQGSPVTPDARGAIVRGLEPWRSIMGMVRYDRNGVGAYFGPHLRDCGYSAAGVNVSVASTRKNFPKYRDQMYWETREEFERGNIAGLTDELTIAQLSTIQYEIRGDGKIAVQPKAEMKKLGGRSPDRADALALAVTTGGTQTAASKSVVPVAMAVRVPLAERELNL